MNRRSILISPVVITCNEISHIKKQCTLSKSFKGNISLKPFFDTDIIIETQDEKNITLTFYKKLQNFSKNKA